MGRAKELMMEEEERGFSNDSKKCVCDKMFPHQKYIRETIKNSTQYGYCDYCEEYGAIITLNEVVEMVYNDFIRYFENPAEELPFESGGDWNEFNGSGFHKEGGGYILPNNRSIMSTSEALEFAGFQPYSDELFDDVADSFHSDDWVLKDAYLLTEEEQMLYDWDLFWNKSITEFKNGVPYNIIKRNNEELLSHITENISCNLKELSITLSKGSRLFRCVNYADVPNPLLPQNLWAPPAKYATAQRMSRHGQSRFYASFDKQTPVQEAVSGGTDKKHCLGEFALKNDIKVLDFTNVPEANILNVSDFLVYRFYVSFANAITQPVADDEKHKYIPTQLMRDIIEEGYKNVGIVGIKYRSVKGADTENVVLFLDEHSCINYLELVNAEIL